MPQMFPMNWWLLSLIPFMLILINMIFMQFITMAKKDKMNLQGINTPMMEWKW